MTTETKIYDDGTEPDVIKRYCCDGRCEQGRNCPGAPAPAEACTEVGHDEGPEALGTLVVAGLLVIAVIGTLAFIVGYFS